MRRRMLGENAGENEMATDAGTIGVFSFIAGAMAIVFVVISAFGPAVTKRRLEAIAA